MIEVASAARMFLEAELGVQEAVQPVEDTGLVPPAQPTPAGLPDPNPNSSDTVAS